LWQGLFEGVIDFVISDHSPCVPALKAMERGDFAAAWGGIASLQLGLSAVWTEARRRGAQPAAISRWLGAGPAEFAGLAPRKGRIAPGADADFVIWDPDASFRVRPERLFFRHPVSPYVGRELQGVVRETWLGGRQVYDGEQHLGEPSGVPLLGRQAA
jgi:allantoinase